MKLFQSIYLALLIPFSTTLVASGFTSTDFFDKFVLNEDLLRSSALHTAFTHPKTKVNLRNTNTSPIYPEFAQFTAKEAETWKRQDYFSVIDQRSHLAQWSCSYTNSITDEQVSFEDKYQLIGQEGNLSVVSSSHQESLLDYNTYKVTTKTLSIGLFQEANNQLTCEKVFEKSFPGYFGPEFNNIKLEDQTLKFDCEHSLEDVFKLCGQALPFEDCFTKNYKTRSSIDAKYIVHLRDKDHLAKPVGFYVSFSYNEDEGTLYTDQDLKLLNGLEEADLKKAVYYQMAQNLFYLKCLKYGKDHSDYLTRVFIPYDEAKKIVQEVEKDFILLSSSSCLSELMH